MNIVLSFVGTLPKYIVDNIHQTRQFFDGNIYLVVSDVKSPFIEKLKDFNVNIVKYNDVFSQEFSDTYEKNSYKFNIIHGLTGREELFIRSIERFFILKNTMKMFNLEDVFFMELDNMIYDDPRNWLEKFSTHELCYMIDNIDRCSSGIMYIKNYDSIVPFVNFCKEYINNLNPGSEWLNEMSTLYRYYMKNKDIVQILPSLWKDAENIDKDEFPVAANFEKYDSIFDAQAIGIYLCGIDVFHTQGVLNIGYKCTWSHIDYTKFKFEWINDDKGRRTPFIWSGDRLIKINSLHVHSKELHLSASKQLE